MELQPSQIGLVFKGSCESSWFKTVAYQLDFLHAVRANKAYQQAVPSPHAAISAPALLCSTEQNIYQVLLCLELFLSWSHSRLCGSKPAGWAVLSGLNRIC